jgi:hypothetical protein
MLPKAEETTGDITLSQCEHYTKSRQNKSGSLETQSTTSADHWQTISIENI